MLPALNVYKSIIPSIELGSFIILITTTIFMMKPSKERIGIDAVWGMILLLFLVSTIVSLSLNPHYSMRYFFRYLKIVVVVASIMLCCKEHCKYDYATKVLTKFSIACSIFITIQTALSLVGIHIPGVLNMFISLQEGDASDIPSDAMYRPTAFFFEPAHFVTYQFVFLCYLLTHPNVHKRLQLLLLTLFGIFLSTSGTGYTVAPILLITSFILDYKNTENKRFFKYVLFSLIGFAILAFNTAIGNRALGRFVDSDGQIGGAADGRLNSGADLLFYALPSDLQWIGCGFGYRPEDVYFPSLYAILYGDGYIGLGALALMAVIYFLKTSNFGKLLLITYSLLFMGGGVFNFGAIGLYFCFISLETEIKQNPKFKLKYLS